MPIRKRRPEDLQPGPRRHLLGTDEHERRAVLDGDLPGIYPYNTGEYDPELVNRSDIMRILFTERILQHLTGAPLTIEISDYQGELYSGGGDDDSLHVYVSWGIDVQADTDIRSGEPEDQALWLYDQLIEQGFDARPGGTA